MPRQWWFVVGLLVGSWVASAAWGVVTRLTPLKEVLAEEQFIFLAKVEKLDPDKPSMVLTVDEDFKGKAAFRRLPVNLTGNADARKEKQTEKLLKRLAVDLPVVVFASKRGKSFTAFVYTNGTWFQMTGKQRDGEGDVVWSFEHCEPYLRRTFKGTTEEMKRAVVDGLTKKKSPPDPDPKVEPGLGPELEPPPKQPDKEESKKHIPSGELPLTLNEGPLTRRAVIPTVFVMGPLMLLASLFPVVFGGLALFVRRWFVALSVASAYSLAWCVFALAPLPGSPWAKAVGFWAALTAITLTGIAWSHRRYRTWATNQGWAAIAPSPFEDGVLRLGSVLGLIMLAFCLGRGVAFTSPWFELLVLWSAVWCVTAYNVWLRWIFQPDSNGGKLPLAAEGVLLGALAIGCIGLGATSAMSSSSQTVREGGPVTESGQKVAWRFETKERGVIDSSPLVVGDRVYVAASHRAGFHAYGRVYCLDRRTGKTLWQFDDDGDLRQLFCSPTFANGKIYIGEGYHQDRNCRLFCLDAEKGKKDWEFGTASHTESSPCVVDGRVYFGAGDDGLYCVDANTGAKIWQFEGPHVDTNPVIAAGMVFAGSGYGDFEVFALDAATGKPRWRTPVDLPAFGSPAFDGRFVYFGIGNGNLIQSADNPAGAMLCLDASTGKRLWRRDVGDAVHGRPQLCGNLVIFGSRDRSLYAVDRAEGRVVWTHSLDSPIASSPLLVPYAPCSAMLSRDPSPATASTCSPDGSNAAVLFTIASRGDAVCLNPTTGHLLWKLDLATLSQAAIQALSSPSVVVWRDGDEEVRHFFFGTGVDNLLADAPTPTLFCFEDRRPIR
jgi:outer membrane protein assembly factor BamB